MKKFLSTVFFLVLVAQPAWALSMGFVLKLNQNTLGVKANLKLENSQEIFSVVRDGVSFKLFWDLEIYEVVDSVIENDKRIFKQTIKREISYSELEREYIVLEDGNKFHFETSFALSQYIFSLVDDEMMENLPRGKVYRIQIRARGESIKLVFPLDVVMKWFTNITDFSTGWKAKEFQLR